MKEEVLHITQRKYQGDTEVVSVRLPGELVRELTFLAKETGRSRNDIIEKCLAFAVTRVKIQRED